MVPFASKIPGAKFGASNVAFLTYGLNSNVKKKSSKYFKIVTYNIPDWGHFFKTL